MSPLKVDIIPKADFLGVKFDFSLSKDESHLENHTVSLADSISVYVKLIFFNLI
jgi:hypothetical protein